ncbi:hypothetical protein IR122_11925, partial [Streptococcus cuniculi]|nr:hypothetical protein [Streptococcus cuniculi]
MKIDEVPKDMLMMKNGEAMPIESLIELWEDMSFEEKEGWHTTVCERLKTDAESVIE